MAMSHFKYVPKKSAFCSCLISRQANRAVGTHRWSYQETQCIMNNRTDKIVTALVISNFLFMAGICLKDKSGWGRVTFIFHAALSEFTSYKSRHKG